MALLYRRDKIVTDPETGEVKASESGEFYDHQLAFEIIADQPQLFTRVERREDGTHTLVESQWSSEVNKAWIVTARYTLIEKEASAQ